MSIYYSSLLLFCIVGSVVCSSSVTSVDDRVIGTGLNQFNYIDDASNWVNCYFCNNGVTYQQGFTYNPVAGGSMTFTFVGTQVKLYGFVEPNGGIASVSIDGGAVTSVDTYATTGSPQVIYTSPSLPNAQHVLKVVVSGRHNPATTSITVSVDRIDVIVDTTPSPSPTPKPTVKPTLKPTSAPTLVLTATVDDRTTGTGLNQFNYIDPANWVPCGGCSGGIAYQNIFTYNPVKGGSVTFQFQGNQVKLYGIKEVHGGIADVSIDGGAVTRADTYSATSSASLIYTSPSLSYGVHTLKLVVSGDKNANADSFTISVDKMEVYAFPGVTASPTTKPTPSPTPKATPAPTTKPTPAPTPKATPAPTTKPTPAPTPKATPAPTTKPTSAPSNKILTGNSGNSIENYGISPQSVIGYWLDRHSWGNIAGAEWMCYDDSGIPQWKQAHFDRAIDVGGPLIPHDMAGVNLNQELTNVINGMHDNDYVQYGINLAKCSPKTLYLRLWWEFNLYTVDANLLRQAWNRAVPKIRQGFNSIATSTGQIIQLVWCPNSEGWNDITIAYPDNDKVDIIASDVYAWIYGSSGRTEQEIFQSMLNRQWGLKWIESFSKSKGKRAAIGEWANVARPSGAGDSAYILNALYDWADAAGNVEYMMYFNLADGGVGMTLDQAPNTVAALKIRAARG